MMRTDNEVRLVQGGVLLYCAGALILWVMPAYLDAAGRLLNLSAGQLGTLAGVELWATAAASLTGPLWMNRFSRIGLVRFAAVVSLVGQTLSYFAPDYTTLLLVRAITGAAGEGLLLALSYLVLGRSRNVERAIGLAYALSILLATATFYLGSYLGLLLSGNVVLVVLWLSALGALGASFLLPAQTRLARDRATGTLRQMFMLPLGAVLVLFGLAIWFAGPGGFWSFCEQLAAGKGASPSQVTLAMAASMAASLAGSSMAAAVGERIGRVVPLVLSTAIVGLCSIGFALGDAGVGMIVSLVMFNLAWNFGGVYTAAHVCSFDVDGRVVILVPACQSVGMALGSLALGHGMEIFGTGVVPWLVSGLLGVSVIFGLAAGTVRRHHPI